MKKLFQICTTNTPRNDIDATLDMSRLFIDRMENRRMYLSYPVAWVAGRAEVLPGIVVEIRGNEIFDLHTDEYIGVDSDDTVLNYREHLLSKFFERV